MSDFANYAAAADKICVAYYGLCHEYAVYLRWVADHFQQMTVGVGEDAVGWAGGLTVKPGRNTFGDYVEIKTNFARPHPVEKFVAGTTLTPVRRQPQHGTCVVVTHGELSASPLTPEQIAACRRWATRQRMECLVTEGRHQDNPGLIARLGSFGAAAGVESGVLAAVAYAGGAVLTTREATVLRMMRPDADIL